jgi:hypothetical protein
MTLIGETTLSASANSVMFSNIPAGYDQLVLRIQSFHKNPAVNNYISLVLNADAGPNYEEYILQSGAIAITAGTAADSKYKVCTSGAATAMTCSYLDIVLDAQVKSNVASGPLGIQAAGYVSALTNLQSSGAWTAAANTWVSTIAINYTGGASFEIGSKFSLWGRF